MPRAHAAWTAGEHEVLCDLYPRGGIPACVEALPHRSRDAIASRVGFLGLRLDPGVVFGMRSAHGRLGAEAAAAVQKAPLDHRALAKALGMEGPGHEPPGLAVLPARVHRCMGGG